MKLTLVLLLFLPLIAQQQPNFSKDDNQQAEEAIREQPYDGPLEVQTCRTIFNYEKMDWLENYSAKHTTTLSKLGITPTSVNILKTTVAKRLAQDLVSRIKNNLPVEEICMYCICGDGICATSSVELQKIYQIGDLLDYIVKEVPAVNEGILLVDTLEPWKKSVIQEASSIKTKCETDMKDIPNHWPKYSRECKTLLKALSYGIEPSALKLTASMIVKLRTIN
ncbi:MAG: hypothetical protein COV29_04315 [Candidatus Yanofskybacteria bacterium CG10_big_fil_rev_8_21_14_0_10_36_16]|uniref:Uncharacterized protein n=1 Tax=Candidatus Yanofskybacteria bacterium CG10_big_fil_rev_8_21_14_0_10_36_16 TaxID=1975096 RepID=A0A2J0QA07_9BACT|nr:MAG: hypothetical protein COV29_04315 [Candidatus Yanofskybacteria bacterium CG10_big_fil_rev_8_21_14_0_10_36_16]